MTPWITILPETVYTYLAKPQVEVLRHSAIGEHQEDPLQAIIRDICEQIRAEISANPRNFLESTPYAIPAHLKASACALIIETAQTRIPGLKATDSQIRLAEVARQHLQRIAQGELPIAKPRSIDTSGTYRRSAGVMQVLHKRPAHVHQMTLNGF